MSTAAVVESCIQCFAQPAVGPGHKKGVQLRWNGCRIGRPTLLHYTTEQQEGCGNQGRRNTRGAI